MASRPNILWICTDSQRWDTLGCYGNPLVHTPRLDTLAEEGIVFEQCFAQSPVCTPSRASFLTGRYPRTTRVRQNGQVMPKDRVLIAHPMAEVGCAGRGQQPVAFAGAPGGEAGPAATVVRPDGVDC